MPVWGFLLFIAQDLSINGKQAHVRYELWLRFAARWSRLYCAAALPQGFPKTPLLLRCSCCPAPTQWESWSRWKDLWGPCVYALCPFQAQFKEVKKTPADFVSWLPWCSACQWDWRWWSLVVICVSGGCGISLKDQACWNGCWTNAKQEAEEKCKQVWEKMFVHCPFAYWLRTRPGWSVSSCNSYIIWPCLSVIYKQVSATETGCVSLPVP